MDLFYGLIPGHEEKKNTEKGKTISNIHTPENKERKSFALWYSEFIIIAHNVLKGIQVIGNKHF